MEGETNHNSQRRKKKVSRYEITEFFTAKASKNGFDRCFYGTIKRETNDLGDNITTGKISVNDGTIWSMAENQGLLGHYLDTLVEMVLDNGIHSNPGVKDLFGDIELFLN